MHASRALDIRATAVRGAGLTVLACAVAWVVSGCAPVTVHSMADPNTDFATFSTFKFLPDGGKPDPGVRPALRVRVVRDPLYHANLQAAIGLMLQEKGLVPVRGDENPDLLIGYHTVVQDRTEVVPPIYGVGWRGHAYVARPGQVHWYKEGTLVIDVIEARSQQLVWRGVGVGAMRDMRPGDALQQAVAEILGEYPTAK